jgi:hypothetical protein
MNSATLRLLASAVRLVGAAAVIILIVIAIRALREARSGLYYVVREKARSRGLRLILVALLVVPVTLGIAAYVDHAAGSPIVVVRATATVTPTHTASPVEPTVTATPELPTDTPQPRPTTTPLPVPTATASPTRIPPTDLPPSLLTPVPSAVAAAENASFGPLQLGACYVNYQLCAIADSFPLDTPIVYATFLVRNMNRNATWTAAWYREGKYVTGDPRLWTGAPNTVGYTFYGSPGGFRPGKWELRLYIEDRLQSKAAFTILAVTSTPTSTSTITPTVLATATAAR